MAGKIFINYRRSLSLKEAQLLRSLLERYFGKKRVFLDVSGLDGGDHWLHTLEKQVDNSVAMVSVICHDWAQLTDADGNRRLDNTNDFVRFELARAFSLDIPVLPVLVDGASMPDATELPTNLLPLLFPQGMLFRAESYDDDADKIAARLRQMIARKRPRGIATWKAAGLALCTLAGGALAAPYVLPPLGLGVEVSNVPEEAWVLEKALGLAEGEKARLSSNLRRSEAKVKELEKDLAASQRDVKELKVATKTLKAEDNKRVISWLGLHIQNVSEDLANSLGLNKAYGALVTKIYKGGPASKSDIKVGDAIIKVNQDEIKDSLNLVRKIATLSPKQLTKVTVFRDGAKRVFEVKLGRFPGMKKLAKLQSGEDIGEGIDDLSLSLAPASSKKGTGGEGVIITDVDPESAAASKGLKKGDIIIRVGRDKVNTPDDIYKRLENLKKAGIPSVLFYVRYRDGDGDGDQHKFLALPLK